MRQEGGGKDRLLLSPPCTGPSPTCCLQPFANEAFGGLAALGLSEPGAREAGEEWSPPGGLRREVGLEHPCLPCPVRTGWLGGSHRAGRSSAGLRSSSSCRLPAELSFADPRCQLCWVFREGSACASRAPWSGSPQGQRRREGERSVSWCLLEAKAHVRTKDMWAPEPAPGRPQVSLWVGPQESAVVIGQLVRWDSQIRVSLTDALPSAPAPINRHGGPREHEAMPCPAWQRGPR